MSFLMNMRPQKAASILRSCIAMQSTRNHGYWNKDYKPGPYPRTKEERDAAAKKYGLLPEEYEPYDDDGTGYGDYPKLPIISADTKDPFYPWDFPESKRNYGDPLHADDEMYSETRYNASEVRRVSLKLQLAQFLGVMFSFAGLFLICENYKLFRPVMERQFPNKDVVHYTFEPDN